MLYPAELPGHYLASNGLEQTTSQLSIWRAPKQWSKPVRRSPRGIGANASGLPIEPRREDDPPHLLRRRPVHPEMRLSLGVARLPNEPYAALRFAFAERHDLNEKTKSGAAMSESPKKNIGPAMKFRSGSHHDIGIDKRHVIAGANNRNIETNPLSLLVAVRAI